MSIFYRYSAFALLILCSMLTLNARIAIVGIDSGGSPDEVAFVSDEFIAAGTNLYFSEDEYDAANNRFMSIEGTILYVVPAGGLPVGRVVIIREVSSNTFTADDGGSVTSVAGNYSLSGVDEEIYVFSASDPANPLTSVTLVHCWLLIETDAGFGVGTNADPSSDVTVEIIQDFNDQLMSAEYIRARNLPTSLNDILDQSNWTFGISSYDVSSTDFTSTFTLQTALPVNWLSFSARANDRSSILLEWQTAGEVQNEGFYVQRSTNAREWKDIGFVVGAGTTGNAKNYTFIDDELSADQYYYRLRQLDIDGHFSYSSLANIQLSGNKQGFEALIFPNPTSTDRVGIRISAADDQNFNGELYDANGRLIRRIRFSGGFSELMVADLLDGVYSLVIRNNQDYLVRRILVQ